MPKAIAKNERDPVLLDRWKQTINGGVRTPEWVRRSGLLSDIVNETLELGRWDLAAENNLVSIHNVSKWLDIGRRQLQQAEDADSDEITPLAQFYLEIQQAKSLFLTGRIKKIMQLADSEDPVDKATYKNFHLWLAENIDEQKRFSWRANQKMTMEENKNISIKVTYADGDVWRNGGRVEAVEGDVVDTEMRQIAAAQPEDF